MARLDLATRAERIAKTLAGRDLTNLPKTVRVQVERFTRAIGIEFEQFAKFAPSTQQKYIRAAKKGRTVAQERERVRVQRRQRAEAKKQQAPRLDPRLAEIEDLRAWLDERVDTSAGPRTQVDELDESVLLSPESIREHTKVYGVDYVLKQLRGMKAGFNDVGTGQDRWRGFTASAAMPNRPDERWYWYHGKLRLVDSPIDWSKLR